MEVIMWIFLELPCIVVVTLKSWNMVRGSGLSCDGQGHERIGCQEVPCKDALGIEH